MGRFVEEDQKPAFIDACFSFAHPITGLFPHGNATEFLTKKIMAKNKGGAAK